MLTTTGLLWNTVVNRFSFSRSAASARRRSVRVAHDADEERFAVELDLARADLARKRPAVAAHVQRLELHAVGGGARHLVVDLVLRRRRAQTRGC